MSLIPASKKEGTGKHIQKVPLKVSLLSRKEVKTGERNSDPSNPGPSPQRDYMSRRPGFSMNQPVRHPVTRSNGVGINPRSIVRPGGKCRIRVSNLPMTANALELRDAFSVAGPVLECTVLNGTGFISYKSPKDAELAVERYHKGDIDGRVIYVDFDDIQ